MNLTPAESSSRDVPQLTRVEVEELRELVRDASARKQSSAFIIEGPHLLERALETNPQHIRLVALTEQAHQRNAALVRAIQHAKIPLSRITEKQSEKISDTRAPQGMYARVTMSGVSVSSIGRDAGWILALDSLQDPGNIGAIIRTAAWFGVKHLLVGEGCADVYSPKALRSTQGEIFSVAPYEQIVLPQAVTNLKSQGYYIVVTTLSNTAGSIYRTAPHKNSVIVFGSEAHGVSRALVDLADESVMIPRYGVGESLNVSTSVGIILSEMTRRVSAG